MNTLHEDILKFLTTNGFRCTDKSAGGIDVICVALKNGGRRFILPAHIEASSPEEADRQASALQEQVKRLTEENGSQPLIITEDRWMSQREMMKARLLAHLDVFFPVYARNCEIRKIDKTEAAAFLKAYHSYGDAACRYRYGMFLKRHTGWRSIAVAQDNKGNAQDERRVLEPGTLVAVAEFSNARKWVKGEKMIRSYEWTRYASLPGVRINGGMGKMLRHFIKEVLPDDIMSYADLEWSEGAVYEQLGFVLEGQKDAVSFMVDCTTWERKAVKLSEVKSFADDQDAKVNAQNDGVRYFRNFGSNKYRLKLTDYQ